MKDLHRVLYDMQMKMIHVPPDIASSPPQRGGCNTKLEDYDVTSTSDNHWIYYHLLWSRAYMKRMAMK